MHGNSHRLSHGTVSHTVCCVVTYILCHMALCVALWCTSYGKIFSLSQNFCFLKNFLWLSLRIAHLFWIPFVSPIFVKKILLVLFWVQQLIGKRIAAVLLDPILCTQRFFWVKYLGNINCFNRKEWLGNTTWHLCICMTRHPTMWHCRVGEESDIEPLPNSIWGSDHLAVRTSFRLHACHSRTQTWHCDWSEKL